MVKLLACLQKGEGGEGWEGALLLRIILQCVLLRGKGGMEAPIVQQTGSRYYAVDRASCFYTNTSEDDTKHSKL